jgi:hypothetical protein
LAAVAKGSDQLDRLVDAAILLLTLGPGGMALFSGIFGAVVYWSVRRPSQGRSAALAARLNEGAVVGASLGFPAGLIAFFARLTNLLPG